MNARSARTADVRPMHKRVSLAALAGCCALACLLAGRLTADEPSATKAAACWAPLGQPAAKMIGMLSCASASCHGSQDGPAPGAHRGNELTLWLVHDPHAQAARTLDSPEFQRILAIVSSGRVDGPPSPEVYVRCAQCHDTQGLALFGHDASALMASPASSGSRGMSCESCHGPAEKWLTEHYRRDLTKDQLSELGMIDTDNLLVRARQCAACHVGDETRDMNHDMIAAGHPPLRFELSAYHDLIRDKHWSDAERINRPQFKAQLWAAGQLAVAEAAAALLESRASRAVEMWPEFAEFDCFACHQRMRPAKVGRPNADLRHAGTPSWQPWNLPIARRILDGKSREEPTLSTEPANALRQARQLRSALQEHPLTISFSKSTNGSSHLFTTAELLDLIARPATGEPASWAAACQELLALKAAYLAVRDEERKLTGQTAVTFHQELNDLAAALRFGSADFEWPTFDWEGLFPQERRSVPKYGSLAEIQARIHELARALRQQLPRENPAMTLTTTQP